MYYVGLDVHDQHTQIQAMDEDGALGIAMNISTTATRLNEIFNQLADPASIVFEASGSYWWLSQLFESHPKVSKITVVDPRRSRHLAEELSVQAGYGRAKNDRIDAEMLAEQLRRQMAPAIHLPTPTQLHYRTLNRHRLEVMCERTRSICRIQALLRMHGHRITTKHLLSLDDNSRADEFSTLPNYVAFIITHLVSQIECFEKQIQSTAKQLNKLLPESHPQIALLMTAPGIGIVVARIIYTEIFSIRNFEGPPYLVSYSGLAPVEQDSDGRKKRIKLNRHCNYHLKYAFLIAAHAARHHPKYRRKYQHDVKMHGKIRAKLNLARKLAKSVYWMLTRQQPFH